MYNNNEIDTVIMRGIIPSGASSGTKLHKRNYSEFVYVTEGSGKVLGRLYWKKKNIN